MFADTLAYVAILSREPEATTARLSELFGLARTDVQAAGAPVSALAVGRSAVLVC